MTLAPGTLSLNGPLSQQPFWQLLTFPVILTTVPSNSGQIWSRCCVWIVSAILNRPEASQLFYWLYMYLLRFHVNMAATNRAHWFIPSFPTAAHCDLSCHVQVSQQQLKPSQLLRTDWLNLIAPRQEIDVSFVTRVYTLNSVKSSCGSLMNVAQPGAVLPIQRAVSPPQDAVITVHFSFQTRGSAVMSWCLSKSTIPRWRDGPKGTDPHGLFCRISTLYYLPREKTLSSSLSRDRDSGKKKQDQGTREDNWKSKSQTEARKTEREMKQGEQRGRTQQTNYQ